MTKQEKEKKDTAWLRYIGTFLLGVLVGWTAVYWGPICRPKLGSLLTSTPSHRKSETETSEHWARPAEAAGVPNLHKVSYQLYRGAQPTAEGMRQLKNLGVKTIVNLRSFHSDSDEIGDTGLAYEHIHMKPWHPEDKEVVRFLQIITDSTRTPVFVHCQRGADRTGLMCAVYRIVVQGWSKHDAIKEMTKGGFGFHTGWENLVRYIRSLNVSEIKDRVGIEQQGEMVKPPATLEDTESP